MAQSKGFWSYVHDDDEAERGRVSQLAKDVIAEYALLTTETIELFLDKDDIEWGVNWRNRIDESLSTVAFFIPVLTPRYFRSAECRHELQFFARRATALGLKDLVLPLLYVDTPSVHEESPTDEVASLIKTFQWEDWRELRFADRESEEYRRGVARLAARLVNANAEAERANVPQAAADLESTLAGEEGDTLGWLDQVAKAETTLPSWVETLTGMTKAIQEIGQLMEDGTQEIQRGDAQGRGFAARLTIMRQLAQRLAEPAERVYSLGNQFAKQLHDVDQGFRLVIDRAASEVQDDPANKATVCEFFDNIRKLSVAADEGLTATQVMIDSNSAIEAMSRDLRPPLRRLREGLTVMLEAREVTDEWARLIEQSGLDC